MVSLIHVSLHNIVDCSTSPPLLVNFASATFNFIGYFICENVRSLLDSNGMEQAATPTTCLATVKWSGQDEVHCTKGIISMKL